MSFLTLHAFLSLSLFLVSGFQFQIPLFPFTFTFFQFASFVPTHVTLRAAIYAAYRTTALLLGSQPAPAGMCSGFKSHSTLFSSFQFPVSGFKSPHLLNDPQYTS